MDKFLKNIERSIREAKSSYHNEEIEGLAQRYGVPFVNGNADAGCPGIMKPLQETAPIELQWGSGECNDDKTYRFTQFSKALHTLEAVNNKATFQALYRELDIRGVAMLVHIASKNDGIRERVLKEVASVGPNKAITNMADPTTKGIFDKYIDPLISPYSHHSEKAQLSAATEASTAHEDTPPPYSEASTAAASADQAAEQATATDTTSPWDSSELQ